MKILKPCLLNEKDIIKVYRDIKSYLNTTLYDIIKDKYKETFKNKLVLNETREEEDLKTYFINNTLYYKDGYIYGKFNTRILKLLEKIGGKYIGYKHAFKIDILPATIYNVIYEKQSKVNSFVYDLDEYLNEYLNNLETSINFSSIDYKNTIKNLNIQLQNNFANIEIIPTLKFTELENINKEYVENTKLYIKGWLNKDIIKLRNNLKDYILNKGYSNNTIAKIIKDNYKTTQKKSLFLARQESSLLLASYTERQYKQVGVYRYKWLTANDERVRNYPINNGEGGNHKLLNNKIFNFDNPPITNLLTGERHNPGESFGCYGKDTEILTKEGFKLLKDIEIGETVATINKDTLLFEWGQVINKVKYYKKDIYKINSNIFNLYVSGNHTFWQWKKRYDGKRIIKNNDYNLFTTGINTLNKKNSYFLATCNKQIVQKQDFICNIPIKIFCQFMGFYLSDGCIDKRTNNCLVIVQQNNDWMYNIFKDYLHICKGKEKLFIYNKDLFNLVKDMNNCYNKYIPEIIKNLDYNYIRLFLNSFCLCDGNGKSKIYNCYYTTSPRLMADLVECIYKTNMSCSVKQQQFKNGVYTLNYDVYTIQELKTKKRTLVSATITKQYYNDYVYDIEVNKNNTILVKQGKSIHWNSNCRCVACPIIE